MQEINFKWRNIIFTLIIVILFLLGVCPLKAYAESTNNKLLLVVDDSVEKITLNEKQKEFVVIKSISELSYDDSYYKAYAFSKKIAENEILNQIAVNAFNTLQATIYIYGNITIAEFKEILKIQSYTVSTSVYDINGKTDRTVEMCFSTEQENDKTEQIISLTKDLNQQSLIVSAPFATNDSLERIIVSHFEEGYMAQNMRSVLVQNSFNYRTYPYLTPTVKIETCYLNMDYYLYKIEDENVSNYDYFALRVNINPIYSNPDSNIKAEISCTEFQLKLKMVYNGDHIYEYGPNSSNRAKNINVSLGFGNSGISGGIGFNFSPSSAPTIDASYRSDTQTVLWKVKKYWLFGAHLNNALYPFGITWASIGSFLAAIDISTYVVFGDGYKSDWNVVQVRFSY